MASDDFTGLHGAIKRVIDASVPGLGTCEFYPQIGKTLRLPAVLIEMVDWDDDNEQPSDGRMQVITHWEARCVIDGVLPDAQMQVRRLAMRVALALHRAISTDVKLPTAFHAAADGFTPELDGHAVWAVEWDIIARMGETIWDPARVTITEITLD